MTMWPILWEGFGVGDKAFAIPIVRLCYEEVAGSTLKHSLLALFSAYEYDLK